MIQAEESSRAAAPSVAVPSKENFKSAYDVFLDQGAVGAVAILAIAALIWAVVKLLMSKDDRIKDQALFAAAMQKTNDAMSALTVEINKSGLAAQAEASRSSAALTSAVQTIEKSVKELDGKVGTLRDEQVRVHAMLTSTTTRGRGR